jgi:two-component system LytT family response regulator
MRSGELGQRLRELLDAHSHAVAASSVSPRHQARILVRVGQRDEVLEASDIDWIQSDDYCSIIHCAGKRHLVRESLAAFESRLDPRTFARIHRSVIVNLSRVTARRRLATGGVRVILRDGTQLPVRRARRAKLDELLGGAS